MRTPAAAPKTILLAVSADVATQDGKHDLEVVLAAPGRAVKKGEDVSYPGLGKFSRTDRKARVGALARDLAGRYAALHGRRGSALARVVDKTCKACARGVPSREPSRRNPARGCTTMLDGQREQRPVRLFRERDYGELRCGDFPRHHGQRVARPELRQPEHRAGKHVQRFILAHRER